MEQIQVSIIVPHYNTPDSLLRLLESIPQREDVEILVVDDNSSVDTVQIADYVAARNNVFFYRNDSGIKGAGAARNVALPHVRGVWTLFADADDFFLEDFMDSIEPYLASDADMVYFPPTSQDVTTGEPSSRHVMYMELVDTYREKPSLKHLTEMKYGFCTPWSKLIRSEIMQKNQIAFDPIMVSNDIMCMTKCAFYSQNVLASKNTIYCVTRGGKSLTAKKDEARFDTRIDVLINRYHFLEEHLSKKEFRYAHIDRLALGKLVDVFLEHWGIKKFFSIWKLYRVNKVKFFDIGLLNPVTLFHKAKIELQWWLDIKKHR